MVSLSNPVPDFCLFDDAPHCLLLFLPQKHTSTAKDIDGSFFKGRHIMQNLVFFLSLFDVMMRLHGAGFCFVHACADKNYGLSIEIASPPACFQSLASAKDTHVAKRSRWKWSKAWDLFSMFQSSVLFCCVLHSLLCHTLPVVGSFCSQSCPRARTPQLGKSSPIRMYQEDAWWGSSDL